jgi:hypothetical protein
VLSLNESPVRHFITSFHAILLGITIRDFEDSQVWLLAVDKNRFVSENSLTFQIFEGCVCWVIE